MSYITKGKKLIKEVKPNRFLRKFTNYLDFADYLNYCDNKTKGDVSEEFWLRWFHYTPIVSNFVKIHNTNDPKSKNLLDKWPELEVLKVGQPNSALVDLLIEYEDDYDIVQCKWYSEGLSFKDIGGFYLLTNQHLPNCRKKYLTTTAPRTSQLAQDLGKMGKDVIVLHEDEFIVDFDIWDKIAKWKTGSKIVPTKWKWRTKREQESFIKLIKSILKNSKTQFQGPPGWGKTFLMYRIERYLWKRFGGLTINMADSVISLKQNYILFNTQDSANGISRNNLVICASTEGDADLVDWPCEIVGNDPAKIYSWLKKNPNGRVFCFYGNTGSLEAAVQTYLIDNPDFEFTSAMCDEAGRTCQPVGSGWSHIVHDKCIPVKYRGFFDATPRTHKKYGMDNKKLYGPIGDHVSQPESEEWGSTSSYTLYGMVFGDSKRASKLKEKFEERELVKGKSYTVEDYCMAVQILESKANDPDDQHTLEFGLTIDRLRRLKEATGDALTDLLAQYPRNKKIQSLKNIKLYVADTHIHSTSDIHRKLNFIYNNEPRSIVYTSRLLYRAWSQVKLDSIYFADNFKGISYIVQALGRGLRINEDKKHKVCRVYVPVNVGSADPWKLLLDLINNIKDWDYRPMESIISQSTKSRKPGKRKPGGGQVIINTSGVKMNVADVINDLNTVIINEHSQWVKWDQWQEVAKIYYKKLESHFPFLINSTASKKIYQKVYKEICTDKRIKMFINNEMKNTSQKKAYKFVSEKIWSNDTTIRQLKIMPERIRAKSIYNDMLEDSKEAFDNWRQEQSRLMLDMSIKYIKDNRLPYIQCDGAWGIFSKPLRDEFAKIIKFLPGDPNTHKGKALDHFVESIYKGGHGFDIRIPECPEIQSIIQSEYVPIKESKYTDTNLVNKNLINFAVDMFIELAEPYVSEIYVEGLGFVSDSSTTKKIRQQIDPDYKGGKKSSLGKILPQIEESIQNTFNIQSFSLNRILNLDCVQYLEDQEKAEKFRLMYLKYLPMGYHPIKKQMVVDILCDCIKNKKLFKEEVYKILPLASQKIVIRQLANEVPGTDEYLKWYNKECIRIGNWRQALKVKVEGYENIMSSTEAGELLGIGKDKVIWLSKHPFKEIDTKGRRVGKVSKYAGLPRITLLEGSDKITDKDIKLIY